MNRKERILIGLVNEAYSVVSGFSRKISCMLVCTVKLKKYSTVMKSKRKLEINIMQRMSKNAHQRGALSIKTPTKI